MTDQTTMPDEGEWEVVAAGDQGYERWRPVFSDIERVQEIFYNLDGTDIEVDIAAVAASRPFFKGLLEMDYPPLCNLRDFELLSSDFLHVEIDPEFDDMPNQSFNESILYIRAEKIDDMISHFRHLRGHLESIEVISDKL